MPNLSDLLALPAGRELDADVRRIMGDEVEWRACHWYPDDRFWNETQSIDERQGEEVDISPDFGSMQPCYKGEHYSDKYPDWEVVRYFSTDIAAAWPLMAEMLADEEPVELYFLLVFDVRVGDIVASVPTIDDAPLAIVRAWLAWKLQGEQP